MNNNLLLSLAISMIPMLAIGFVTILVIYKIYIKIRSKYNVNVNCWFCNQNTKVPYLEANCWTCPSCEQYNGFDKNGDYNREIYEQLDCSRNSDRFNASQSPISAVKQQNGFCKQCNEAQRLKVEKLAQFEPKNESHWEDEYKLYKDKLEDEYRLCSTCARHLNKVLREKKKMVLGSKFLDFIIKGAETLKQPHLSQIKHAHQEKRKQKLRSLIIIMSLINLYCLAYSLPSLSKDHFIKFLGESLGHQVFLIVSHILAVFKVMGSYLEVIKHHMIVIKFSLFARTLFMMVMYSMGLKVTHLSFCSLFISLFPFGVLTLSFMHNIVDGFRLTRFTALVVIWSMFAGGLIKETWSTLPPQLLPFLTSLITLMMVYSSKSQSSPKLYDATSNSFHKIYSEDYFSDDETASIISQQLSNSCASMSNVRSNKSSPLTHANVSSRLTRTPLPSSSFTLQNLPRSLYSPSSSFRSCAVESNQTLRPTYDTPAVMPLTARHGFFGSNLELNSGLRSSSILHGLNGSLATSTVLNNSFSEHNKSHCSVKPTEHNDSFYTAANNSINNSMFAKNNTSFVPPSYSRLHSPFSISSGAVFSHQHQQQVNTHHNLLSPTRFSTNNLASSNTSWLSGGYFNQRQTTTDMPRNGLIIPTLQNQTLATPMEENLSRSSSHSSGFESQNGRLNGGNMSRENSLCPEFNLDHQHRPFTMENINSFQPIEAPSSALHSPRPSLLSNPSLSNYPIENTASVWKQPAFAYRSNNSTNLSRNCMDSFNLRKINEELPAINRGDLLQNWKGQTIL